MDWQGITAIIGALAGLIAILGLVYNLGRMNTKIDILWDAFKAQALRNTMKGGTMESSSDYHLTPKGRDMIPSSLKDEIKLLAQKKRINPGKVQTFQIVKMLGGVSRLAEEAEKLDIDIQEMIVMVETYIHKHLGE